jgi:DUF971 family protein
MHGLDDTTTPTAIEQTGPAELRITWRDGHESAYFVSELRRACPCASCVDEFTGERVLRPEDVSDDVRPIRLEPVGRYALQFQWSDGHATGIYPFELLRALCPCPECRSKS